MEGPALVSADSSSYLERGVDARAAARTLGHADDLDHHAIAVPAGWVGGGGGGVTHRGVVDHRAVAVPAAYKGVTDCLNMCSTRHSTGRLQLRFYMGNRNQHRVRAPLSCFPLPSSSSPLKPTPWLHRW